MMKQFKPMLAAEADLSTLKFPLIASPKLDGVRALVKGGVVLSRSLKPIPNKHVQKLFGRPELEGLDGELIVGSPTDPQCFQNTSGAVRRVEGEPDVRFYVFDCLTDASLGSLGENTDYVVRAAFAKWRVEGAWRDAGRPDWRKFPLVYHWYEYLETAKALRMYEKKALKAGYEGLILRDPDGPYKFGRSTTKEGYLLKLKRFKDSEARVLAVEELMHNANEAKKNELGQTERSAHKENLVPAGTMGRLHVEDIHTGQRFYIGTGFTAGQRTSFWEYRHEVGNPAFAEVIVKYKFFPVGVKELPRHPVYLGLREGFDMSN